MEGNVSLYKVLDVVKRTDITKAGDIVEHYEVYFETASNVRSSVIVPINASEEDIRKAVEKEAEKIEKIMKLKK